MKKAHATILERISADIDEETAPDKMSLDDAKEFLDELASAIDAKLDGIKDDLKSRR